MATVPGNVRLARHVGDLDDDGHDTTGGSITEITDIPTAETDTDLRLAPDGVGGVEWAATTNGRWELAVITGSPPDPLYADGDFLYILVP